MCVDTKRNVFATKNFAAIVNRLSYTRELIMGYTCGLDEVNKKRIQNLKVEFLRLDLKVRTLSHLKLRDDPNVRVLRASSTFNVHRQIFHSSSSVPV
jgi:hypothetical protein